MKHLILTTGLLLALCVLSSCGMFAPSIVGVWEAKEMGGSPRFVFERDGTGSVSGTHGFGRMSYQIDYDKAPIWIDLTSENSALPPIRGIIEFSDRDTIRIKAESSGDRRPTSFSKQEPGDELTLVRVR